jgi:hypothetical protein
MEMAQFRNIEIDSEVHQLIENERRGCNESPNDALRWLLKIGEPKFAPERDAPASVPTKRSWSDKGVVLPHGTAIRMEYMGHIYQGYILDGEWVIGDQKFDSPSGAASGVAVTKKGKPMRLGGWKHWHVKLPGETDWALLDDLRQGYVFIPSSDLGL